jgi:hypothetical protein
MFHPNSLSIRPLNDCSTHVLGPVFTPQKVRLPSPFDDLLEAADRTLGRERVVEFDRQCSTIEIVDDIEKPERSAISQLIVHEFHRP